MMNDSTQGRKAKGRGKKQSLEESSEVENAPVAKRGRPKRSLEESSEVEYAPVAKRGRPKRSLDKSSEVDYTPVAKRGRPKRSLDESSDVEYTPVAKRGRPKRSLDKSSEVEYTPAAKRGRPKRSLDESSDVEYTAVAKRGRPKRSLDESSEVECTPVAKKGRPRKTPVVRMKSPEIAASTMCMRCDKDLTTLAGLKFHLMTVHQALWAKDCPEGMTDTAALKRIMKAQGKLVCQQCKKELRYYHYYVHHIKWCGREEERTVCEVCGRSQKSMWYHAHLVYHKKRDNDEEKFKQLEQQEKEEIGDEDLNKMGKTKRKSAKKAMQTLAEIGADENKTSRFGRRKGDSEDDYSGTDDSDVDRDFQGSSDEMMMVIMKLKMLKVLM
ncbi:zinc finger protein 512-like [Haliotis rubra]|uniref:zinc finger protein 512-like n=1 Tax=Haliotis rubra TaxID=36100 RepID=UPI001EE5D5ED|nr:zinc finger protein 512-like [Haliotis rubra]